MTQTIQPQVIASRAHLTVVPRPTKPPRKRGPYSQRAETREELEARRASILRAYGQFPHLVR